MLLAKCAALKCFSGYLSSGNDDEITSGVRMKNFLVCFYSKNSTDIFHQVLVRSDSQDPVSEKAKAHFRSRDIPENELSFFSVEEYGQAKIDSVEII